MTKSDKDVWLDLLKNEVPPLKLGNKNTSGKCGMCGVSVKKLYPHRVGKVDFMICGRCKSIMDEK